MLQPRRGFPRHLRLVKASDFQRVFDQARRLANGRFTLLVRPNGYEHARLGIVISSKCAKLAVNRNRLKRLIRESFRLHQEQLQGWDIVIIGRPGLDVQTNQQIMTTLRQLWIRLING